jgi:hypothetical protein
MNGGRLRSLWSHDLQVMLRPAAAYRALAQQPAAAGKWLAVRRPLLLVLILGCTISFAASGRLTLRLVLPAIVYASLAALIEVLSLAVVRRRAFSNPGLPSFSRSIDLFFAGFAPWLVWLLAFAAVWAFASPVNAFRWTGPRWDLYVVGAIALWSCYVDFCFFRYVFQSTRRRAALSLLIQRALSWILAAIIFSGGSLSEIIGSSRI